MVEQLTDNSLLRLWKTAADIYALRPDTEDFDDEIQVTIYSGTSVIYDK